MKHTLSLTKRIMRHRLALTISMALCITATAWGNANWKMHNTFDEEVTRIVDTRDHVYFISRTQPYVSDSKNNNEQLFSLFLYDKEGDELINLSTDNMLSGNVVECIEYSPEKGMLVVVYSDQNVDLIYDDGKVENISAYSRSDVSTGKNVRAIYIDAEKDRVYLCTDFGYVALNDRKREVAESRIYGVPVKGMARLGDTMLLLTADAILSAPADAPRFNLSEYSKTADMKEGRLIATLSDDRALVIDGSGSSSTLYMLNKNNGEMTLSVKLQGQFYNVEHNANGVSVADRNHLYQYRPDGNYTAVVRQEEDRRMAAASYDLEEFWFGKMRLGIRSKRYTPDAETAWTLTRGYMTPVAPAPYIATSMAYDPTYGLMVANHGYTRIFTDTGIKSPILLSGYRDGTWTQYAPAYTNPDGVERMYNPIGLAIDPDNHDYIYFGSILNGLERINVKDGTDILHLSRTSDPYRDQPGYVEVVPDQTGLPSPGLGGKKSWKQQCYFSAPEFDSYGNLWIGHSDHDDQIPLQGHIFCWLAEDRRASKDASTYRPMKLLKHPGLTLSNFQLLKPLKSAKHKDVLLRTPTNKYEGEIAIIHTNGTPADASDDKVVNIPTFIDQDGNNVEVHYVTTMFEDPITGYVWVGHYNGVFYFNPSDWLEGKNRVYRIKVARNDGTNLADYLLDQVGVNMITTDSKGRKWFATMGAGVVCTSTDGRTIEEELTTDNSPLPDDIVYSLGYMPDSDSMLFSTAKGIAEYYIKSAGGSSGDSQVRAYPNPVRPDYGGYVTIDGIEDGSLVKIADAHGNLVKELGYVTGGEVKWDVTNMSFRRVGSGVYYILTSPDENSGNSANVGKILVVN